MKHEEMLIIAKINPKFFWRERQEGNQVKRMTSLMNNDYNMQELNKKT